MDFPIDSEKFARPALARLQFAARSGDPAKVHQAAARFEAMFLNILFSELRKAMAPEGFFGDGVDGDIFQSIMEQNLSEMLAQRGQFGIARLLERQLSKGESKVAEEVPGRHGFLQSVVDKAARLTRLPGELIHAVIEQESGGRVDARSASGAKGLMQLMDSTAAELGVKNVFDPLENVVAGSRYLKRLIDQFGDLRLALAAYNAGPAAVQKYSGIPPFPETRAYVAGVMRRLHSARTNADQTGKDAYGQ